MVFGEDTNVNELSAVQKWNISHATIALKKR